MPSMDNVYGGNTLKAEDVPPNFRAVLRVESVGVQEFDSREEKGKTERKLVLRFVGRDKGLALNVTNANMMAEISGSRDYDNWIGHSVTLYRTTTEYAGKRVPALRLDHPTAAVPPGNHSRPSATPLPPPAAPPAEEFHASDDDIPF